jgi:hypothetical protein
VAFDNPGIAAESQRISGMVAASRSVAEAHRVPVKDNSFDARPGLWSGNLPVISLIADTPWVYSEFGSADGGGSYGITTAEKARYIDGLAVGLITGVATSPQCSPVGGLGRLSVARRSPATPGGPENKPSPGTIHGRESFWARAYFGARCSVLGARLERRRLLRVRRAVLLRPVRGRLAGIGLVLGPFPPGGADALLGGLGV